MSQNSAVVTLTINQFRPIGGVFPISASLTVTPDPGNTAAIVNHGKNISIKFPSQSEVTPVLLTFQLTDPARVLLGIVFGANQPKISAGRLEFPTISVARDAASGTSTMVVTDECLTNLEGVRFNYLILVQDLETGSIGVIDPDIEDETPPN